MKRKKKNKEYILGIDTSAYTTSMSIINLNGHIKYDLRKTLYVEKNKLGLRQQEAVFQHINNLPKLFKEIEDFDFKNIRTVVVSSKPRNKKDSYMPVFLVGKNQGEILSKSLDAEYKEFSHQEGHIGSGLIAHEDKLKNEFLSLHISGGTSEILLVKNHNRNLEIDLLGGTLDLSFGQLIDRIGIYMGLGFPSGKYIDELSKEGDLIDTSLRIKAKDKYSINISGLENYFKDLIDRKYKKEDISLTLLDTITKYLKLIIVNASKELNLDQVLITGGVAANSYIREKLPELLKGQVEVFFPRKELCTDNSVGISYLAISRSGHQEVEDETASS